MTADTIDVFPKAVSVSTLYPGDLRFKPYYAADRSLYLHTMQDIHALAQLGRE